MSIWRENGVFSALVLLGATFGYNLTVYWIRPYKIELHYRIRTVLEKQGGPTVHFRVICMVFGMYSEL